jgi:membrane protease YdiL (CAAX protease family)
MLSFQRPSSMHWDYALILIFLGAVVPLMGRWRVERLLRGPATTQSDRLRLYASTIAFQWILSAIVYWRATFHGMSIASLGLGASPPVLTAIVAVALVTLLLANQLVSLRHVGARPDDLHSKLAQVALRIFPQDNADRLIFMGVVATVAICEEFLFRGFVQSLFRDLSSSAAVAVVGSACLFSLAHLYQGKRGLIATFVVGLLFSASRVISGSLLPSVAGHFVTDLVAGYLFPGALRHALSLEPAAGTAIGDGGVAR